MTLADWGVVASIFAVVSTVVVLAGRALFARLDHLDTCVDVARRENREGAQQVRAELLAEQRNVSDALRRHTEQEEPRLSAIEQGLAWVRGKLSTE